MDGETSGREMVTGKFGTENSLQSTLFIHVNEYIFFRKNRPGKIIVENLKPQTDTYSLVENIFTYYIV